MAFMINNNFQSDFTNSQLMKNEFNTNKNLEHLASGQRINSAADDSAGLFIADQLKTYAISLDQGTRNAQDGISIAQIGQGALGEVYNTLNDIKAKVVEAGNTMSADARTAITNDIASLVEGISKVLTDTEFNGTALFGAADTTFNIQYGGRSGDTMAMTFGIATADSATATVTFGAASFAVDITDEAAANTSVDIVDNAIKAVDNLAASIGSNQIQLEKIISNNETQRVHTSEAESRVRNVDFAKEMSEYTSNQVLMQAGTAMLAQANQQSQLVLQLLR